MHQIYRLWGQIEHIELAIEKFFMSNYSTTFKLFFFTVCNHCHVDVYDCLEFFLSCVLLLFLIKDRKLSSTEIIYLVTVGHQLRSNGHRMHRPIKKESNGTVL